MLGGCLWGAACTATAHGARVAHARRAAGYLYSRSLAALERAVKTVSDKRYQRSTVLLSPVHALGSAHAAVKKKVDRPNYNMVWLRKKPRSFFSDFLR